LSQVFIEKSKMLSSNKAKEERDSIDPDRKRIVQKNKHAIGLTNKSLNTQLIKRTDALVLKFLRDKNETSKKALKIFSKIRPPFKRVHTMDVRFEL